jgi:hypothetical protein
MQPPVQQAGDDDIARQARAVQEEQQADGNRSWRSRSNGRAACGQERCEDDRADSSMVKVSGRKRRMGCPVFVFRWMHSVVPL